MRRLVVVAVVLLFAFSLVGCGGGAEEAPPETGGEAAQAPVVSTGQPVTDPIPDRSAEESAVFEPFPVGEGIPESVAKRVADKDPLLLLFIDSSQKDTNDIRNQVNRVVKDNSGLVDLVVYDLSKHASVSRSGEVRIDEDKLQESEAAKSAVVLARTLGVNFTPYIVLVDDQGYIIYRHRGYVDAGLLEPQVQRVTD